MSEGVHNVFDPTEILANIATLQADVVLLQEDVDAIEAIAQAQAILEEAGGELTTDGTAQTVYINNAPAGVYAPKLLTFDFANQTVTETILILVYYRIAPAGPWVVDDRETIVGVPVNAGISIQLHEARYGIWITIEKTAGDNLAYDWQVFYEV